MVMPWRKGIREARTLILRCVARRTPPNCHACPRWLRPLPAVGRCGIGKGVRRTTRSTVSPFAARLPKRMLGKR
eukprot:996878-Alexandrium_andersonii.AAC.1